MQRTGEMVRQTGLYRVTHQGHRPTHNGILWQGETFPRCRCCGSAARFQFVRPAPESEEYEHMGYDRDFLDSVLDSSAPQCPQLSA